MSHTFPEAPAPAVGAQSAHGAHLNPSVVVIVVVLCVVLIFSGLLHLLARCLGRRRRHRGSSVQVREHSPLVSVLHGQLQQLFHLHDAGVEQAFIDTLPVFSYGSIRGLKDSADCAVCLTEFGDEDRLRLLPKCKHAFHLECIDTWLLSNSTCPLCRRSLLPDPSHLHNNASSSLRRHSEPLLAADDDAGASSSASPEESLANPKSSRIITNIGSLHGSLHGSYQNSFRICDAGPSSDHDDSDQNEIQELHETQETQVTQELHGIQDIQEIHEIEEFHEVEDGLQGDVDSLRTPSPFAPTIRVLDIHGTPQVLKVELGRVASRAQSETRKLTTAGARSYSMGSYEYIVDPSSWELSLAPTPYPGRPQDWAPSKPTHRSALSDSIPELASAGVTPANDELFWASRGLYNPHTLSRVRELLTPIESEGFSPFMEYAYSPGYGDRWIDIDIEHGEVVDSEGSFRCQEERQEERELKQRSSSLSRLPESPKLSVTVFRRSLSETSLGMEQAASALLVDGAAGKSGCEETRKGIATSSNAALVCEETLRRQGSLSRRFSLNWLMGRDKRMVFAAASPVTVTDATQPIPI